MRRRRDDRPAQRPPGAGSVFPELPGDGQQRGAEPPAPEPPPAEPEPERPAEPRPVDVRARFVTAARALIFAEQAMQAAQRDGADCYRGADGGWWVAARLTLGTAREMAGLGEGRLYVQTTDGFAADRGWGDEPTGAAAALPGLTPVALLDLVRVAGLHRAPARPLPEACVLVPGYLVRSVLERAQDLGLRATYQLVQLDPLFDTGPGGANAQTPPAAKAGCANARGETEMGGAGDVSRSCYAVWLAARPGRPAGEQPGPEPARPERGQRAGEPEAVPAVLLSALAEDPFMLVCRPVAPPTAASSPPEPAQPDRALLIGYGTASPLSDGALARLVTADGAGTCLLAAPPDGCARVTWRHKPLEAASLIELGPAHALGDLDGSQPYAQAAAQARGPVPRPLTLVPFASRAARVDAVLLDDTDLECLPLLLAGDPIADSAVLIRGALKHLLTAPGGLLTELAVGEPLTCVGPGSVYLPTGYRLDPPLGPAARAAIFRPDNRTAQVMLRDARLGYDLDAAEPVWGLWAGPVPELDPQLPRSALADLDRAAREIGDPPRAPDRPPSMISRLRPRSGEPAPDPAAWLQQAARAERERDYATAAQLYARNNQPLRAARMWEREAQEKY